MSKVILNIAHVTRQIMIIAPNTRHTDQQAGFSGMLRGLIYAEDRNFGISYFHNS